MLKRTSVLNTPPILQGGPKLLHELILWRKHPNKCAIEFTSGELRQRYSYWELESCMALLQLHILEVLNGLSCRSSQQIIPVLLPQSPGLYISYLAILASGAAFCPINIDMPKDRIKFITNDVAADLLISNSEFKDLITCENGPTVILIDEFISPASKLVLRPQTLSSIKPDDLAYVMYTSGSTGLPKGVGITHLAVTQSLIAHEKYIPPFKRFLQFAAPSFDISVFEIFFPLARSSTVVGCDRGQLLDDLPRMINELKVDAAELTPTVVGSLIRKRSNVPKLELLLTIGEMLTSPIVKEFGKSETKDGILYAMYGPTEATIHCMIYPRMSASAKPNNIGIPLDTVSTFIASPVLEGDIDGATNVELLPIGQIGELLVSGPQLAWGYLNNDQKNLAFFQFKGTKYYRTGDRAMQLDDGSIEILGRLTEDQVKIRGQRVELREIEEAIYSHPGIKAVATIVIKNLIVVYVIANEGYIDPEIDSENVMKICRKWLPRFMLPNEIKFKSSFPYLISGKVDKKLMKAQYLEEREKRLTTTEIFESKAESLIEKIVYDTLGSFPRESPLLAVGLDSLKAIKIASNLRGLGFSITVVSVLRAENLDKLIATCIDPKTRNSLDLESLQCGRAKVGKDFKINLNDLADGLEHAFPCTPQQSAMLSESAKDDRLYRNLVELEITGVYNSEQFIHMVHILSQSNPTLRTGFMEYQHLGRFIQFIRKKIPENCFESVKCFNHDFDCSKDQPLEFPIRFQILEELSCLKVLIKIHHALYDAWSLELLLDDLDDLISGKNLPLRQSFESVVNWYMDLENSTIKSWSSKDYWKDHLVGFYTKQLPNFNPSQSPLNETKKCRLQTSILSSQVEEASRRLLTSSQSIFQAAFCLVLSSYLGASDICFGVVLSGRTLPISGIESIVGPCIATLPIRVDISTSDSLHHLVKQLSLTNTKHLEHIISPVDIKSASGFRPGEILFDTILIWQQTMHQYDHVRKYVSQVDSADTLEFKLVLDIIPHLGNIELKATYRHEFIPESQVNLLLRQVESFTEQILKIEDKSIDSLSNYLEQSLLSIENKDPIPECKEYTLHSPVERIAVEDPDRAAIKFAYSINGKMNDIQIMSYFELNSLANKIAHYLIEIGAIPNKIICICLDKSLELYTTILAITKAGAAWLPIMPDIPANRFDYILRQNQIQMLITHSDFKFKFKNHSSIKVIFVDQIDLVPLLESNIIPKISPNNLAYGIFTSGSTGQPKCVLITQKNILSHLETLKSIYPASKETKWLQFCTHTSDVSVADIFFTWKIGGCLCSTKNDLLFKNPESTISLMKVTHLSLTPTLASFINPDCVPLVEFLVVAGEIMTSKVLNSWVNRGLWIGYGLSETTNIVSLYKPISHNERIGRIGYPLKTTSVFVLCPNSSFSPVPRGGMGELCFGGSQILRGYIDKDHEEGKIIHHPKFGRIYRSGDCGRLMPDGSIFFLGRNNDQVKAKGIRIELGEISNLIVSKIPEINNCTTMIVPDSREGGQRLVCFWASEQSSPSELYCLQSDMSIMKKFYDSMELILPAYMIPSVLIPISFIPITGSGKVDSARLIKLFNDLSFSYLDSILHQAELIPNHQWSSLEKKIISAVAKVAKVPINNIKTDTCLFSLGIDSISAIFLSRVLQKNTGYQLSVSDILRFPSITRLATKISSHSEKLILSSFLKGSNGYKFDNDLRILVEREYEKFGNKVQKILPCTPLQEAILSAVESCSENIYCNQMIFDVRGNFSKLQQCWQEMVRRHEILRTYFQRTDYKNRAYVQVILKEFNLQFKSITKIPKINPCFEKNKPPYTIEFLHTTENDKLVLSIHHALYDHTAISILYEEIQALYYDQPLKPVISFSPFLEFLESKNFVTNDIFWSEVLNNCSFPKLKPHKNNQSSKFNIQSHSITLKSPYEWIKENCQKYETSLLSVLMTVWASVLAKKLQATDICFGNVVSCRNIPVPGIERLVAPCFNTIPSRIKNIHELSYLEAFRIFQKLNTESLDFQFEPLRRIQKKFDFNGSCLFDSLIILQQPLKNLDSSVWVLLEERGFTDLPLVCEITPKIKENTLELKFQSQSSILNDNEVKELMNSFEEKLLKALENPRRQVLSETLKLEIIKKQRSSNFRKEKPSRESIPFQALDQNQAELCEIIADFSDIPREKMNRSSSIFYLGVDSISIIQFTSRLKKKGYNVMVSDVFKHPTIHQLSAFLAENKDDPFRNTNCKLDTRNILDIGFCRSICLKYGIRLENVEAIRPCTVFQQGLIARTIQSNGKEYFNSIWLEFDMNISISNLKNAWISAVREHQIFRTGLACVEDIKFPFVMVTYRDLNLPWFEIGAEYPDEVTLIENLIHNPWKLYFFPGDDKIKIKFTVHHALYDALSIQMFFFDVARSYKKLESISRPPLNLLYDAVMFRSQDIMGEKKSFWSRSENRIIVNRFPDLNPLRVSDSSSHLSELKLRLRASDLEAKCRDNCITMQAAVQAAWARLLAIYVGEISTTFGITLSGRSVHEDAKEIPFPSTVTLPVRFNISGSNSALLNRSMKFNSEVYRHQFTPLNLIQKWSGCLNEKIFDTILTYRKISNSENNVILPWQIVREDCYDDYTVSLEVQSLADNTLKLSLCYRLDFIPIEQASIILDQYEALLIDLLSSPDSACDLVPQDNKFLLSVVAAKEPELPGIATLLHEFVELGAKIHPKKIAFEFVTSLDPKNIQSRFFTYEELDQDSNKVSNLLVHSGIKPGDVVAICFEKCVEATVASIGILKAGCICVALDPNSPTDRIDFILRDSKAKILLKNGEIRLKETGTFEYIIIHLDLKKINGFSHEPPKLSREIKPEDISYILYTSGTTGCPKGCLITHDNFIHFMRAFSKIFSGHWGESSKFLQFASYHFDVSIMEQFWSWSVGICVVSVPRDLIFEDITAAIQILGVTHIDLTPSLARILCPEDVPSLCQGAFITGGEQLEQSIVDKWGKYLCLYNGYGPTEVTIGCTMNPRISWNAKSCNIGPAYINVGAYVLKPSTESPVFRGGVGELCVSGRLVGKGYLNKPDLTMKKFPTLKSYHERVFRTGDLVRILHDDSFMFIGRADNQVKLRGQRLEPDEIKETIKKNVNDIDEIVVLVLKHKDHTNDHLVAFFVTHLSDSSEKILDMRCACKSWLPGYMVPSYFIPIEKMPLSPTNKINLAQLSAIYNRYGIEDLQKLGSMSHQKYEWSSREKEILLQISRFLNVETSILCHSINIFELGLDSISIIRFSHFLQNAGLKNAKLSVVRNNPCMGNLVKALLSQGSSVDEGQNTYIAASQNITAFSQKHMHTVCQELNVNYTEIEYIAPCTPLQEGMIYKFLENKHALYFNKFVFQLNDSVDTQKLLDAWNRVASYIEVMRIKFVATGDGFCQTVMKSQKIFWGVTEDYYYVDKIQALKSPYCLSINLNIMTFQIFHGLYDDISLRLLLGHVISEYNDVEGINYGPSFTSCLPCGPLATVSGAEEFWCSHLKNLAVYSLPNEVHYSNDWTMSNSAINIEKFDNFRKKIGAAPQAIIQACWVAVLSSIISSNITIGIIISGRSIDFRDVDLIVGPLFNTVPFNIQIRPEMTLEDLILICQDFNMKMLDFQHTALKDIQKWVSKKRIKSDIFQTLFNFQRQDTDNDKFYGDFWREISAKNPISDYPVALDATLDSDNRRLSLSLITLASFISQEISIELLKQLEDLVINTIKASGKNKVSFLGLNQISSISDHGLALNNECSSKDKSFVWTRDAEIIKNEISILANINEDAVNENSSIYELGLDSIDVIKLFSRLKKQGVEVPVSKIITSQTIAKMVSDIEKKGKNSHMINTAFDNVCQDLITYFEKSGDLIGDIENILPATPLQQSMVNEMKSSGNRRYFTVDGFKICEDVDIRKLKNAIETVVKLSPILRTTFHEVHEPKIPVRYAQIIRKYSTKQEEKEAIVLDEGETIDDYLNKFREDAAIRVDMTQKLFFVNQVIEGDLNFLVIAKSHALYDGTSLLLTHEDIKRAYNENILTRPDSTPYLEHIFESTTEEAKRFWKARLSGISLGICLKKQASRSEDSKKNFMLERRSHISLKKVEDFCKKSNITLQTLGQTCWALVLTQMKKSLDVIFGTVLQCRDSNESLEVNFPLMNTVILRSTIHGKLFEMLKYMQKMNDSIHQYQHFPLGVAQAYALSSIESQFYLNKAPIIDTIFIYQGRKKTPQNKSLYELVHSISEVEFPISVEMQVIDNNHILWITACKSDYRDFHETKAILDSLESTLNLIVSEPDSPSMIINEDEIQICGLSKFKINSLKPRLKVADQLFLGNKKEDYSNTEQNIRRALHTISGVPEDNIHKNMSIYHLGLDSIQVLKLPALLKASGLKLNMSSILRGQTILNMARSAQNPKKETPYSLNAEHILADVTSSPGVSRELNQLKNEGFKVEYIMPATAGQYYMIRQCQASGGSNFFAQFEIFIPGNLNQNYIESTWSKLIKLNDILRTGFLEDEARLYQVIFENPPNQIIHFSTENSVELSKFKLDIRMPPINLIVVKLPSCKARLILDIHHALYDAISLKILLHEFQRIYNDEDVQSENSSFVFKDFVIQSFFQSQKIHVQDKWKSYIGTHAPFCLIPAKSLIQKINKKIEVYLPANSVPDIVQRAKEAGLSVDALFLAVLSKLQARIISRRRNVQLSEDMSVCLGLYIANRAPFGDDLSQLMAPTLNILPLCIRQPLSKDLTTLALEIQSDIHEIAHSDMASVNLCQIYEWTGTRVDFCINILKQSPNQTPENHHELQHFFNPISFLRGRCDKNLTEKYSRCIEIADALQNLEHSLCDEAYISPLEIELYHYDNVIDLGIFGGEHMISVEEAENLAKEFIESWTE